MYITTASICCLTFLMTFDLCHSVSLPENLEDHPTVKAFRKYLDAKIEEFEKRLLDNFKQQRRYRRDTDTHSKFS